MSFGPGFNGAGPAMPASDHGPAVVGPLTFSAGIIQAGVAAPVAELLGLPPLPVVNSSAVRVVGIAVGMLGILTTFGAQLAMGASWRNTVDPTERPALVTTGLFRIVRNPIYTAVIVTVVGLVLTTRTAEAVADKVGGGTAHAGAHSGLGSMRLPFRAVLPVPARVRVLYAGSRTVGLLSISDLTGEQ